MTWDEARALREGDRVFVETPTPCSDCNGVRTVEDVKDYVYMSDAPCPIEPSWITRKVRT